MPKESVETLLKLCRLYLGHDNDKPTKDQVIVAMAWLQEKPVSGYERIFGDFKMECECEEKCGCTLYMDDESTLVLVEEESGTQLSIELNDDIALCRKIYR